jgi:signal transduction histidine kinase/ActR/RegA family two-component response regulator
VLPVSSDEFGLLSRLVAALAGALTPEDVIGAVAQHALPPLGACAGFVALVNGESLEIRRALGAHEQTLPPCSFPLVTNVPAAEAVRERRVVTVASPEERARRYPQWNAGRWSGYGAWMAAPLDAEERAIGAMLLCFAEPTTFDDPLQRVVQTVAQLCAQALHRALLLSAAEEAARKKDEFLAILGHELRNPLAPIQTALELLKLRGDAGMQAALDVPLQVIERQVRHLTRLVDDLMDVSRITRGKIVLQKETVDVRTIVARAVEMAAPLFEHKSQHLRVESPAAPIDIDADPVRLAQVMANLLTNAAKYTPTAGHVTVRLERGDDSAVLSVRDDGAGISRDILPHLFDLFVQGPRGLDRAQGGLGIGLTLVRSLVELHGGLVEAHSDGPGQGSEFVVRLPLSRGGRKRTATGPQQAVTAKRRVLLVDDNVDAAAMIGELLGELGYAVAVAHDAVEALKVAGELKPEVALLDLGLPVMDGYQLADKLRAADPTLRLVAVTGYGQESDRRRTAKAGFAAHLTKPVTIKEIVSAIEERGDMYSPKSPKESE